MYCGRVGSVVYFTCRVETEPTTAPETAMTILWTDSICVGFKRHGLCWWYHCSEAGMTVFQCGPLVIELSW